MFDVIYITGGSGFIGRCLMKHLIKLGIPIVCLGRWSTTFNEGQFRQENVAFIEADLTDFASLTAAFTEPKKCLFIHLAAVGLRRYFDAPNFNVDSTEAVSKAFINCGKPGSRFLFASSVKAVDDISTNSVTTIQCPYAASKRQSEIFLREKFEERLDVELSIIRIPAVFGPGDENLKTLFQMSHRGFYIYLSKKLNRPLPMIFVEDLAEDIIRDGLFVSERIATKNAGYFITWNDFISEIRAAGKTRWHFELKICKPLAFALKRIATKLKLFGFSLRVHDICFKDWSSLPLMTAKRSDLSGKVKITFESYL